MFCDKFENQGILYLYNELEIDEREIFEAHLQKCAACRRALEQLAATKGGYSSLELESPSRRSVFLLKIRSRCVSYPGKIKYYVSAWLRQPKFWIPVTVSSLAIIFLFLTQLGIFNKKQTIPVMQEQDLAWTVLSDDSIRSITQQIDAIFVEKLVMNSQDSAATGEETWGLNFNDDLGLAKIQQDIILLSWDINQSYF